MGSCGLREDGGPADHDGTGPPVPEPLSATWLHLQSPRALTPSTQPHSGARKRQSREEKLEISLQRATDVAATGAYRNSGRFFFTHIFVGQYSVFIT